MKSRFISYGLIVIMTAFSAVVQANDEIVKKPFITSYHSFDLVNNLIVVKAELSGIQGNYIFDTGSTGLVLNSTIPTHPTNSNIDISGASTSNTAFTTRIDEFKFGNILKRQIQVACMSLEHIEASMKIPIDGLIGMDIVKSAAISIDYANQMLMLSDPTGSFSSADVQLDLEFNQGVPTIQSSINGEPITLAVDFGATSSIMDISLVEAHNLQMVEQIDLLTASGVTQSLDKVQCEGLVLGGSFRFKTTAIASDLAHLQSKDFTIDGIIGLDLLKAGKIMINPSLGKLYIWTSKNP